MSRKNKKILFGLIGVLVLCIAAVVITAIILGKNEIHSIVSKVNIETTKPTTAELPSEGETTTQMPTTKKQEVYDNIEEAAKFLKPMTSREDFYNTGIPFEASWVKNILLIGIDARPEEEAHYGDESTIGQEGVYYGNSDTMILVSINEKTEKIYITSIMRDSMAFIPMIEKEYKVNQAHEIGGSAYLCDVLSNNFKIKIDKYVRVSFMKLVKIIDALGGIDFVVDKEDVIEAANGLILDMCWYSDYDYEKETILGRTPGMMHLDGMQTVGVARVRFTKDGLADFGRTQRQRMLISTIIGKIKSLSLGEIVDYVNEIAPYFTTNMSVEEMENLVYSVLDYMSYEIKEQRIPYDGTFTDKVRTDDGQSALGIFDHADTAMRFAKEVYGATNFPNMPSETSVAGQ